MSASGYERTSSEGLLNVRSWPKGDIRAFSQTWLPTTLREKLVKIGAKVVRDARYITFQLAEVAVSRKLLAEILRLIDGLRPRSAPT